MTEDQQFDEQQSTKIVWWIIGLSPPSSLAGGVGWMNHVAVQVDDLRQEQKVDDQDRASIRERTSKLETKLDMVIEATRNTNTEIKELREDIRRVLEEMIDTKPPWMVLAEQELARGVREYAGPAANPRIVDYHAATSFAATDDEVPWCSSFVNWCLQTRRLRGHALRKSTLLADLGRSA